MSTTLPDEILARLRHILGDRFGIQPESIAIDSELREIGVDSFALIELVFLAEETYGVKIPLEGLEVKTVRDLVGVVATKVAEPQA